MVRHCLFAAVGFVAVTPSGGCTPGGDASQSDSQGSASAATVDPTVDPSTSDPNDTSGEPGGEGPGTTESDPDGTTGAGMSDGSTDGSTDTMTASSGSVGTGSDGASTGEPPPPSEDPFEVDACSGVAWTGEEAVTHLGAMSREVLDSATIRVRTRACPGDVCGDWDGGVDWDITYLTYSGGVTTRWMDLPADMSLVLFDDGGTPALSMQHVTFGPGSYPDSDGMIYDFPPEPINYPHIRAFNQFPEYRSDYIDLDYQVSGGVLVLGEGCAVWTASPFGQPEPHTEQYGAIFHW